MRALMHTLPNCHLHVVELKLVSILDANETTFGGFACFGAAPTASHVDTFAKNTQQARTKRAHHGIAEEDKIYKTCTTHIIQSGRLFYLRRWATVAHSEPCPYVNIPFVSFCVFAISMAIKEILIQMVFSGTIFVISTYVLVDEGVQTFILFQARYVHPCSLPKLHKHDMERPASNRCPNILHIPTLPVARCCFCFLSLSGP